MNDQSNVKFRLNNSELWGGLIGLALGGFVIWSGLKLKLGTINDPGSGFVLFYTGILMCLFAASIIDSGIDRGRADLRLTLGEYALDQAAAGDRLPRRLFLFARYARLSAVLDSADAAAVAPDRSGALDARHSDCVLVPLGMWWVLKRLLLIQLPSGMFEIG